MAPRTIGRYRLLDRLGEGGMGVVWRAVADDGEVVAIKTLRVDRPALRRALLREITGLAHLDHPGIAGLVDHGEHQGSPWYAMPWIEGRPLVVRRDVPDTYADDEVPGPAELHAPDAPLDVAQVATAFHRVCGTLAWLHGEGIVHRDLKPGNVVLRADGWPVLVDFGLAGRFAGGRTREVAGDGIVRAGTVGWMAPEQRAGGLVDARADLYALGAMLYLALAGSTPPEGSAGRPPPRPSEVDPELPAALDELVVRLLAQDPWERPGHAEDVARVLEACGADPTPWPGAPPARPYVYRARVVGRDAELRAIDELVAVVARGGTGVVLFQGEAGAGRSRLVLEAASRAFAARIRPLVVVPGAVPTLGPALAQLPGAGEGADRVAAVGPTLATLFPDETGEEASGRLPGGVHGVVARLADAAEIRPLLLVIDDLDEADEEAIGLVSRIRSAGAARIGVVATVRDPSRLPVDLQLAARPLPALDGPAVARVVRDLLAVRTVDAAGSERLAERTQGRPLLVVEAIRTAVEVGLLERVRGRWRASEQLEELLPAEQADLLSELFLRRAARLSPAHREVLAVAALTGDAVDVDLVRTLLPGAPVDAALAEGVREGTLDEGEAALRFVHAHTRGALLGTLSALRRRELHGRAADHLRGATGDPHRIARHLEGAGRSLEALRWWRVHAQALAARGRPLAAAAALGRALGVAPAQDVVELRDQRMRQYMHAGRLQAASEDAREVIALAGPGSTLAADAARYLARVATHADAPDALEVAADAVRLARACGDPDRVAMALAQLAHRQALLGRSAEARRVIEQALALGPSNDARVPLMMHLGTVLTAEGRRVDAERCYEQLLELASGSRVRLTALANLSVIYLWGARHDRVRWTVEQAAEGFRAVGDLDGVLRIEHDLACADLLLGRSEAAAIRLRGVAEAARRASLQALRGLALLRLVELHLDRGELDEAAAALADAEPVSPSLVGSAQAARVRLLRRLGDLDGAERVLAATEPIEGVFGDPRSLLAAEAVHLAWARGRDGAPELARLDAILARFPDPIPPDGFVGLALARVERARAALTEGRPLVHGEG